MSKKEIKEYLAKIGAKGGKKSRRKLTTEQSKAMLEKRKAKRERKIKLSKRVQEELDKLREELTP